MAVSFNLEEKSRLYITYSGIIDGQEVLASQNAITDNYDFEELRGIILDVSAVEENLCSEQDVIKISAIAKAQSKTNPTIKNAVIIGINEESQALTAYYQLLAESTGWSIELFKSKASARGWLNA